MPSQPKFDVRPLTEHSEFRNAVELQKEIWGFEDIDVLPLRFFVVATKIGGQALGAFHRDRMIGFCMAVPGLRLGGKSYMHSHMLGVLPEFRNAGVGRKMKLAQREEALSRGIDLIEWTFDPLELKNAYFNIERLGAIVRHYRPNQYGTSTSTLHGRLPTDRCVAEWWLWSPRVRAVLAGQPILRNPVEARIAFPSDIAAMRVRNPERTREIQQTVAGQFAAAFDRELTVIGFEKSEETGTYLLGKWESNQNK
jgi:predicted GNAT superfamily acetyltransferase